jgi:lipopolysaccharide/colanic/teichoic acid biosynthesis glycosyltransferase
LIYRKPPIPLAKRALDLGLCGLALIVLGPVMLIAALAIKLSSRGPVFYRARRAGYRGQPFYELKFRTMRLGSDVAGGFTARKDPRVLAVGAVLRLFKIDELPQIMNILRGEMSIVGPRPEAFEIVEECYTPEQRRVLEVAPGLTGFPQVRYFPDLTVIDTEGRDPQEHYKKVLLPMRLELDLEYVRRQSFLVDLGLILETARLVLFKSWWVLLFGQAKVKLPEVVTPPHHAQRDCVQGD